MYKRSSPYRVVIAIPVRDEEERIAACLQALSDQDGLDSVAALPFEVLLFVNNSDDRTAEIARALASSLAFTLTVANVVLPPLEANAGAARRHAMELAACKLENGSGDGILMTTDADSRVLPDWIAASLAAFDQGVDAVAGAVALESEDEAVLPVSLKARGALEGCYENLVCKLETLLAPLQHDPWPRHPTESGASLALTLKSFRAIGGVPDMALGEDRAIVAALRHRGFRVRHAPDVRVMTSGRLYGRAAGGCADTMRLRIEQPDALCDTYLRPVFDILRDRTSASLPTSRTLRPDELPAQIRLIRMVLSGLSAAKWGRKFTSDIARRLSAIDWRDRVTHDQAPIPPLNPDGGTATP